MKPFLFPFHFTTIRSRLTFWSFFTTFSVLIIFAVFVSVLIRSVLHTQIDHHIHTVITEANTIVESYAGIERDTLLSQFVSTRGMTVLLLSADGTPIVQTNSSDLAPVSEHQAEQVLARSDTATTLPVHFTIQNMRFAVVRVGNDPGNGVLAVGYSLEVINETITLLLGIIIGVTILFLIPCVIFSSLLIKHSLSPLESMAKTMEAISEKEELTTRLSEYAQTRELRLITEAFNRMLGKIQSIFQSEQEFFSDAAHTLKTPLAVLRAQVETLHKESDSKKKILLDIIDRAVETTQDLLFIARIGSAQTQKNTTISLSSMCEELGELASSLGEIKHLSVITTIEQNLHIHADPTLLRRAFSNIVHNAITYSPVGGRITLVLHADFTSRQIVFFVTNEGIGIAKKELKKIFTRFYRGTSSKGTAGSGLGLAITKAVLEQLGGKTTIHSVPHKETRVTASIPM